MTGEEKDKHDSKDEHNKTNNQSSDESEEDSDKDKKKMRRQSIKTKQAVQQEVLLGRERQREFLSRGLPDLAFARGGMGFAKAGPAWVDRSSLTRSVVWVSGACMGVCVWLHDPVSGHAMFKEPFACK